jgi:hypothetical protein
MKQASKHYLFLLAAGNLVNMFVWSAVVSKKKKQLAPLQWQHQMR